MHDYQKLWDRLKQHYKEKVEKFEVNGRSDSHPCINAKSTLNVMEYLEICEQNGEM